MLFEDMEQLDLAVSIPQAVSAVATLTACQDGRKVEAFQYRKR